MDLMLIGLLAALVVILALVVALLRTRQSGGASEAEVMNIAQAVLDRHAARLTEAAASERDRQRGEDEARRTELNLLLKPLSENLEKVESKLQLLDNQRAELKQQLDNYRDLGKELNEKTSQLSSALRRPEVRGRWGEMQLRRLVELAGMVDYVDFDEQLTVISDDERLRPDMVIKLTQGGQIAVDSKVPLDAYLDSVALQGPERDTAMEKVAKQIRTHIKQLSDKEYWRELDNSANFTVMFIPIEGAFQEAVGVDPSLVEYAANHKVAIATPFTLLGMLHTIARLETQFQIAQKIDSYLQEARKLHKRASVFADHLGKAQKSVTSATKHIDSAARSFDRMFMKSIEDMNSRAIASGIDEPDNDPLLEIPAPDYDED
ncbi:MAG: DNA recombination protein RmuC [Actinobacteria bacterium]|jgi:DNA recombination protein RmuC|uniref:Unannotated protein n=1 Tax=freshwater metagenome TaxID=449393 RepID=A0A6J6F7T9_9ZZZZ|nr:DNA recombination protein RmuC [Actinomycetota bacterium]